VSPKKRRFVIWVVCPTRSWRREPRSLSRGEMSALDAVDRLFHPHESTKDVGATLGSHDSEELAMQSISTVGLDIAKSVLSAWR
jgi:hypothetical protein